jgi:hypothetical protein
MAEKIDISALRLGSICRRPKSTERPIAIEDRFEPAPVVEPTYRHNFHSAKDETFYPGLRQITVMPGDTLWGVLGRQGFKAREITYHNLVAVAAQINGMEPNEVLRIGQPLLVPSREFLQSMVV